MFWSLLRRDDEHQWERARAAIFALTPVEPGFIPLVTLAESVWVLRSRYRLAKADLVRLLQSLFATPELVLEEAETVGRALRIYTNTTADFTDVLIERSAASAGCSHTLTFDEQAAQGAGMRLVP